MRYLGAIHIHTKHSDGTGDIEYIAKSAKKAGLSWLIITDHNNFDVSEGIINGVYVIKGEEISPENNSNHYLVFGTKELISPSVNAQDNVNNVRNAGGFGFAAHPDESENRNNSFKPIKWLDKNVIPDGIEIWNRFSQWGDFYNDKNIFTKLYSVIFRNRLGIKPYRKTLEWWDELNNKSEIVPAIGGVDAHALKIKGYIIPLTIFSYDYMFKTIANAVEIDALSKDFSTAKNQILNALKNGNNIIVNRQINKKIPEFYIKNICDRISGGETSSGNNNYLVVKSPVKCDIKVLKNGTEYSFCKDKYLKIPVSEGKYRVELTKNGRGYAYSNPIIVK